MVIRPLHATGFKPAVVSHGQQPFTPSAVVISGGVYGFSCEISLVGFVGVRFHGLRSYGGHASATGVELVRDGLWAAIN